MLHERLIVGLLLVSALVLRLDRAAAQTPAVITITAPTQGDTVLVSQAGTSLTITVQVTANDYTISGMQICATNRLFGETTPCTNIVTGPPYQVTVPLQAVLQPADDYQIKAAAFSSGGIEFDSAPVSIRIERSDPILGLSVSPGLIDASDTRITGSGASPRTVQLTVTAHYGDDSDVNVTESNRISYVSGDDGVAQIGANGQVTLAPSALLNSQITVQAVYPDPDAPDPFPVAAVVPVVNVTPIFGDLNGDGVVDLRDVALMQKAITQYLGASVDPLNAFDLNHDGYVNVEDLRLLILQCDNLNCAQSGS